VNLFGFARVNVCTIVYTNITEVTKFTATNNKTTTSASRTACYFGDFTFKSFVYMFTKLHDRRIPTRYKNPDF